MIRSLHTAVPLAAAGLLLPAVPAHAGALPAGQFQIFLSTDPTRCVGWSQDSPVTPLSTPKNRACDSDPTTVWRYDALTRHLVTGDGRCLDVWDGAGILEIKPCDAGRATQMWEATPTRVSWNSLPDGYNSIHHPGRPGRNLQLYAGEGNSLVISEGDAGAPGEGDRRFGFRVLQ
ncbi:hypothetical protein ACFV1N_10600 [Streptosporangium canum]|uniref:hypothetical protein n=1 Tax=Streptosporangium canum TaxID=324952 RepID=UPI00369D7557